MIWVLLFILAVIFLPAFAYYWAAALVALLLLSITIEAINNNNSKDWIRRL